MNRNLSLPPKERINISYRNRDDAAGAECELPLKLLVVGDFTGRSSQIPIEERKTLGVDRENFDEVMAGQELSSNIEVSNHIQTQTTAHTTPETDNTLRIHLKFKKIADFSPESICEQSKPLKQLIDLRQALVALKGPLGNFPQFRRKLEQILRDPALRERLMLELSDTQSTEVMQENPLRPKTLTTHTSDASDKEIS